MNFLCILIPVLVGLISALLGYLLGKLLSKDTILKLQGDLDLCRKENERQLSLYNSLKGESDDLKVRFNSLKSDFDAYKMEFSVLLPEGIPFDAGMAASIFQKKVIADDLKIVEGIGPKIEELFHNAGIMTWKKLAETGVGKCQQILDKAGDNYKIHNPSTWPKQSEMAYLGKWVELKKWQDAMTGGRE